MTRETTFCDDDSYIFHKKCLNTEEGNNIKNYNKESGLGTLGFSEYLAQKHFLS